MSQPRASPPPPPPKTRYPPFISTTPCLVLLSLPSVKRRRYQRTSSHYVHSDDRHHLRDASLLKCVSILRDYHGNTSPLYRFGDSVCTKWQLFGICFRPLFLRAKLYQGIPRRMNTYLPPIERCRVDSMFTMQEYQPPRPQVKLFHLDHSPSIGTSWC